MNSVNQRVDSRGDDVDACRGEAGRVRRPARL